MLRLEQGMRVQLLQDVIYYNPQTFEPYTISEGTCGEIAQIGVGLPRDMDSPPVPIISIKFNDMTLTHSEEMSQKFRKIYRIV